MAEYSVKIPFAGYFDFQVKANSEEEAKEKAWKYAEDVAFTKGSFKHAEAEWEFVEEISRGNVLSVPLNKISIEQY